MAHPVLQPDLDVRVRDIKSRLERARDEAYEFLKDFDYDDINQLMDDIEEELYWREETDDDEDFPEYKYSGVEILRQMDVDAGVCIFEGAKRIDADVMAIFAAFALSTALQGLHMISGNPGVEECASAAEMCADAFAALHYGKGAQLRGDPVAKMQAKTSKGGYKKSENRFNKDGKKIIRALEKVLSRGEDVIIDKSSRRGVGVKYRIKDGDKINVNGCKRYIYDNHPEIVCDHRYIKQVIMNHLGMSESDEEIDMTWVRTFPRKYVPGKS